MPHATLDDYFRDVLADVAPLRERARALARRLVAQPAGTPDGRSGAVR